MESIEVGLKGFGTSKTESFPNRKVVDLQMIRRNKRNRKSFKVYELKDGAWVFLMRTDVPASTADKDLLTVADLQMQGTFDTR